MQAGKLSKNLTKWDKICTNAATSNWSLNVFQLFMITCCNVCRNCGRNTIHRQADSISIFICANAMGCSVHNWLFVFQKSIHWCVSIQNLIKEKEEILKTQKTNQWKSVFANLWKLLDLIGYSDYCTSECQLIVTTKNFVEFLLNFQVYDVNEEKLLFSMVSDCIARGRITQSSVSNDRA